MEKGDLNAKGFSLLELMIVLSIISILAGLSYPSYMQHLKTSHYIEARAILLTVAQQLETYYLENHFSYADATLAKLKFSNRNEQGNYSLSLISDASSYLITAHPKFRDKECGDFTLSENGSKTNSILNPSQSCW